MQAIAPPNSPSTRKRAVNLTLNEALVGQARAFTCNLSATIEELLAAYVAEQQQARAAHLQQAESCCAFWNAVDAELGAFADEHSTL